MPAYAVGGLNGQVFMLALDWAGEICIGIVSAGIVLAGTDFERAAGGSQMSNSLHSLVFDVIEQGFGEMIEKHSNAAR